jgi:hypothetical protein
MIVVLLNVVMLFLPTFFGAGAASYFYFMLGAAVAPNHSVLADFVRPLGRACIVLFFLFLSVKFAFFAASMEVVLSKLKKKYAQSFFEKSFVVQYVFPIFAATESATLPIEQRTRAGLLLYDYYETIYKRSTLHC